MITLEPNHFASAADAEAELASSELFAMEFAVPAVASAVHWHRFDAVLYLLEGELQLTDASADKVLRVTPGCKVTIPQGTLHAELSDGYRVLLGSSIPAEQFDDPVDLAPDAK